MSRAWTANTPLFTLFVAVLAVSVPPAHATVQEKAAPKSEKKSQIASLAGCIDEHEGQYVLVDDRTLTPIATLEADGFPTEGFAKFLGHKVTVRGISISGSERPRFKVRNVEQVSETCAPQQK